MINDENYAQHEQQMQELFYKAGWVVHDVPNYERIDRITDRAIFENVVKETTSFVFISFSEAITGFCAVFFGSVAGDESIDYKP